MRSSFLENGLSIRMCYLFLSLLVISCSKYQSFDESEQGETILKSRRWEVKLPYKSGKNVTIDLSRPAELLMYESGGDFHVVRIPLETKGEPGIMRYAKLDEGKNLHQLSTGQLLVETEEDNRAFVALLDSKTLDLLFSTTLKYSTSSIIPTSDHYISFEHWTQKGDMLIFFHNLIRIRRYSWTVGDYSFSVPYVVDSRYDIYLINLATQRVRSFFELTPSALGPLGKLLKEEKSEIISQKGTYSLPESQKVPLDRYVYTLDKFFLVDDQQVLIFSLENEVGTSLYYLLDLRKANAVPTWDLPENIAAQYPYELNLTEADTTERMNSQDLVVKNTDMIDVTYAVDEIGLSPAGFVLVGREKYGEDVYADGRSVAGLQILADGIMKQTWCYHLGHHYRLGPLLFDPLKQRVFFPEEDSEGKFNVVGCMTDNGKKTSAFPANILIDQGNDDKGGPTLRIVGTAVDFEHGLIYIHNQKRHSVFCADIDLPH